MNAKGMIEPFLASCLVSLSKPENKSQYTLIKDLNSTKLNNFLINAIVPVTLYSNMLTFRVSIKSFILDGDLLITLRNFIFN